MANKRDFPQLEFLGPPTVTVDRKVLDAVELAEDFKLPESYCDFAAKFGYGRLCNLLIVYVPMGKYGDSLSVRSQELRNTLSFSIENDLFEYAPAGSPELVRRLIPFGISENGHTLAWDRDKKTGAREHMIYVVGSKALAVYEGGPDLYTFVERCLDARVKKTLGPGYSPLSGTFKPIKPVNEQGRSTAAKAVSPKKEKTATAKAAAKNPASRKAVGAKKPATSKKK